MELSYFENSISLKNEILKSLCHKVSTIHEAFKYISPLFYSFGPAFGSLFLTTSFTSVNVKVLMSFTGERIFVAYDAFLCEFMKRSERV